MAFPLIPDTWFFYTDVRSPEAKDARAGTLHWIEEPFELSERVGGPDAVLEQLAHQAIIATAVPPEVPAQERTRRAAQVAEENGRSRSSHAK